MNRVQARGYFWATPGPYLRKSMLLTLARRISNQFLPEVFYESTFTTAEGCPQRSAEEEEELAMGLDHKMQEMQGALGEMAGLGDEDGSDDEDGSE